VSDASTVVLLGFGLIGLITWHVGGSSLPQSVLGLTRLDVHRSLDVSLHPFTGIVLRCARSTEESHSRDGAGAEDTAPSGSGLDGQVDESLVSSNCTCTNHCFAESDAVVFTTVLEDVRSLRRSESLVLCCYRRRGVRVAP
jgi:hypothetical protein